MQRRSRRTGELRPLLGLLPRFPWLLAALSSNAVAQEPSASPTSGSAAASPAAPLPPAPEPSAPEPPAPEPPAAPAPAGKAPVLDPATGEPLPEVVVLTERPISAAS